MKKGANISSQTVIFAVSGVLAAGILGGGLNLLDNNIVEERLMQYRAEELATSIGVVTQYGDYKPVLFTKRFSERYKLEFENVGGGEQNLTMSRAEGDPNTVEVEVPTTIELPEVTVIDDSLCVNKTRDGLPTGTPEEVNIRAGPC